MSELRADGVRVTYGHGARRVEALKGVSVAFTSERSIGIAGESGSGKSTLGRLLVGMNAPDSGSVTLDGISLATVPRRGAGALSRRVQMVFQDPGSSLNPRMTVGEALQEAMRVNAIDVDPIAETRRLIDIVGLDSDAASRYPFQFSGGQRQRIAIARALAVRPNVIVCDEPTSALDVSVQAAILRLLRELRYEKNLALAVITHNLDVVRYLCDDVVILRHGEVVEHGATADVFSAPTDAYTRALLDAVPAFRYEPFSALPEPERWKAQDLAVQRAMLEVVV